MRPPSGFSGRAVVMADVAGSSAWGLGDAPAWGPTPGLTLQELSAAFDYTLPFTIGVEEELMLIDASSFELAPVIDDVLPLMNGDRRFAKELRAAQIELISRRCARRRPTRPARSSPRDGT
jgi:hypothetical protein